MNDPLLRVPAMAAVTRYLGFALTCSVCHEDSTIFPYTLPFHQRVHLAALAGIGRAAARELAQTVARWTRSYSHGAARPKQATTRSWYRWSAACTARPMRRA